MTQSPSATVTELATRRKTARKFQRTSIDLENVHYCVRAAAQAPSGANRQPWRFVLVDDEETKARVRTSCEEQEKRLHQKVETNLKGWFESKDITWQKQFLTDAPVLLAVFSNQKMPYATESTWLAVGYILLALEERSLSTLTYTPSYPENVRAAFGAPDEYRLETILPIGYSADTKPKEERRSFESLIHRNTWNLQR
jgi:nitroreductase